MREIHKTGAGDSFVGLDDSWRFFCDFECYLDLLLISHSLLKYNEKCIVLRYSTQYLFSLFNYYVIIEFGSRLNWAPQNAVIIKLLILLGDQTMQTYGTFE